MKPSYTSEKVATTAPAATLSQKIEAPEVIKPSYSTEKVANAGPVASPVAAPTLAQAETATVSQSASSAVAQ